MQIKHIKKTRKEQGLLVGKYLFTKAKIKTPDQWRLMEKINEFRAKGIDVMPLIRDLNRRCQIEKFAVENLIPTVGRTMVVNNLFASTGTPDNTMLVTHIALGTDATAPANGDSTLGTEVYRNTVASKTNAANLGYCSGFYHATEDADHYYEAGVFSNGTGSVDTGILLSHVAIDVDKSLTETLTIDWTLTIS